MPGAAAPCLQATFLPVVTLFEGAGMMLQALHSLRRALESRRGLSSSGAPLPLPPPLQRALQRGESVAAALLKLCQVGWLEMGLGLWRGAGWWAAGCVLALQ